MTNELKTPVLKETVTSLTMKTRGALALQSVHNKAVKMEVIDLRSRVEYLEGLVNQLLAAPVMKAKQEHTTASVSKEEWREAHESLVAEAAAAGKTTTWFARNVVLARCKQLEAATQEAAPAEDEEFSL